MPFWSHGKLKKKLWKAGKSIFFLRKAGNRLPIPGPLYREVILDGTVFINTEAPSGIHWALCIVHSVYILQGGSTVDPVYTLDYTGPASG